MNVLVYNVFLRLYKLAILIASLFNAKAKRWVQGRKNIFPRLEEAMRQTDKVIWIHCASLGEFEQGRPILEDLKASYPAYKILLTFFSPSGYEIRKNYPGADHIFYLPLDTAGNARKFLDIVNPQLVIFVKYEYWYNLLQQLHARNIPTLLVSAIFREQAVFFKWYGGLHRRMAAFFSQIFVQNEESLQRIATIVPPSKLTLAGDTRFDRVSAIAAAFEPLPVIAQFAGTRKIMVAGSTWPDDESMLKKLLAAENELGLIIAPHEIHPGHLNLLNTLFPDALLYSTLKKKLEAGAALPSGRVLIIDNIGMLSKLYKYGTLGYIGGGFNKSGIHNSLEAAVYGKPVLFGPNYQKFAEASGLVKHEAAFSYQTAPQLIENCRILLDNPGVLSRAGENAGNFVRNHTGATAKILHWLRQNVAL